MDDTGLVLHSWIRDLFPISRSVVGPGIDHSLLYFQKLLSVTSKILTYPSGAKINGWTVPEAWELHTARIEDMEGNIIVSSEDNNLHLWSHSIPFEGVMSRSELESHLLTSINIEGAIPYATTYYNKNWGFSVDSKVYQGLNDAHYRIIVQTSIYPDTLKVLEVVIPGESESEVLFSTYLCHPSMANNELSGPALATSLIRHLSTKRRKYTYRFVFAPETIGPICYLSDHSALLKSRVFAAFNLTCVGGGDEWSFLRSPDGNTLSDRIGLHLLRNTVSEFVEYDFLERGSDERQYASPNIDLPMVSIMRSKYAEFKEYHNSLDDLFFVTAARLQETLDVYESLIQIIEAEGILKSTQNNEPFLSNTFNYPTVGARTTSYTEGEHRIANQIVAFSRNTSTVDLANRIGISVLEIIPVLEKCINFGLVKIDLHGAYHSKQNLG